jgi:hypothetical protein
MAGALAVGALTLAGTMTPAAALESKSVLDGMAACNTWCENHNPPGNSRNACLNQCRKYWYCNGSDALKYVLNCKFYKTGSATIQTNPQTTPQSRPKLPLSTTPLAPAQ